MPQKGRWLVPVLLAVLVAGAAGTYWLRHRVPDRVDACGRTFGHHAGAVGAGPFTLREVRIADPEVRRLKELPRGRELWVSPACGLGVYVRVSQDAFLGYGLLGGP